jgi:hypothetical protein
VPRNDLLKLPDDFEGGEAPAWKPKRKVKK